MRVAASGGATLLKPSPRESMLAEIWSVPATLYMVVSEANVAGVCSRRPRLVADSKQDSVLTCCVAAS
jgi:hypothetical protein